MKFAFRVTDFLFHLKPVTYKNNLTAMYCQETQIVNALSPFHMFCAALAALFCHE